MYVYYESDITGGHCVSSIKRFHKVVHKKVFPHCIKNIEGNFDVCVQGNPLNGGSGRSGL